MKKPVLVICLLAGLFKLNCLFAQNDTIIIEQQVIDDSAPEKFDYVKNSFKNKTSHTVISIYTDALENYSMDLQWYDKAPIKRHVGAGLRATYERKIPKYNSLNISGWYFSSSDNYNNYGIDAQYRYYFDLKKRIIQAITGNGFSANYVGVKTIMWLRQGQLQIEDIRWDFDKGAWKITKKKAVDFQPLIELSYGLQRELLRNIAVNFSTGVLFYPTSINKQISPHIELTLGYSLFNR